MKDSDQLYRAVLLLENVGECRRFFRDLLTEAEIKEFSNRWKVAQLLDADIPYETITKETDMSSTTIARVSKWLTSGKGGYRLILDRMHHHTSRTRSRAD